MSEQFPPKNPHSLLVQALLGSGLLRDSLYPGEDSYFKANPTVAGMAAEDNRVILNPYSPPDVNRESVALNEMARLFMRNGPHRPAFSLTPEQSQMLAGTTYEAAPEQDRRETIAARLLSGDPSAGMPTGDQYAYKNALVQGLLNWKPNGK